MPETQPIPPEAEGAQKRQLEAEKLKKPEDIAVGSFSLPSPAENEPGGKEGKTKNEDRCGCSRDSNSYMRGDVIAVLDGSGGSVKKGGGDREQIIGGKMDRSLDLITHDPLEILSKTVADANNQVADGSGYGTMAAVQITRARTTEAPMGENSSASVEVVWMGDAPVVAWSAGDCYDREVRNDTSPLANGKTSFQLVNEPENAAFLMRRGGVVSTDSVDNYPGLSTNLDNMFGAVPIGEKITDFEDETRVAQVNSLRFKGVELNADFLLVGSDGMNPGVLIAAETDDEAKKTYKNFVQETMQSLSRGEIEIEQAAQKICEKAREILEDNDDITVSIIDVRCLKPKTLGEESAELSA